METRISTHPKHPHLYRCAKCRFYNGILYEHLYEGKYHWTMAMCMCYGMICRKCKKDIRHRPNGNFIAKNNRSTMHVSLFSAFDSKCKHCSSKMIKNCGSKSWNDLLKKISN